MMHRPRSLARAVALAASAAFVVGGVSCSRSSGAAGGSAPCILLVTQERLRSDRTGSPGDAFPATPAFDRLAAAGAAWDDLLAVAPLSLPAHASLLTGRYPPEHGLRVPGGTLAPEAATLAERLRTAGYRTAAFLADPALAPATGLNRGFERYDAPDPDPERAAEVGAGNLRFRAFETPPGAQIRPAAEVAEAAIAWLLETPGKNGGSRKRVPSPFFVWVHFAETLRTDLSDYAHAAPNTPFDPYDRAVAAMDRQLERLLEALDRAGLGERTLVVATGVHGAWLGPEAPAEEGLALNEALLQVPCALRLPGRIAAGTRIAPPCSQASLAPTLLELCGLPDALPAPLQARSIAAALTGQAPPPTPAPVYAESLWPAVAYALPPLAGWWDATRGFVAGAGFQPRRAASPGQPPESAADGDAVLQRLRSDLVPLATGTPPDPLPDADFAITGAVDRAGFVMLWQRVARRMRRPDPADETLLEDCRRLVAGRPDHAPFQTWLGIAHALRQQAPEAVDAHRRALELAPDTPHLLANLGIAYLQAGDLVKAIDALENAYLARPSHPGFRDDLATVLMSTGVALTRSHALKDAMACLTRVVFLQPGNPAAQVHLGNLYREMKRADLAEASYRRALELRPGYAPALAALKQLATPDPP